MKALFACALAIAACCQVAAARASGSNCYSIRNSNEKNYCLALVKRQDSYCHSIRGSADTKNLCLAQVKGQKSYCYSIRNSDEKNQCLALVR